jgi:hypothetical protein
MICHNIRNRIAHVSLHCSWNLFCHLIWISSGLWSSWKYTIHTCCGVWATVASTRHITIGCVWWPGTSCSRLVQNSAQQSTNDVPAYRSINTSQKQHLASSIDTWYRQIHSSHQYHFNWLLSVHFFSLISHKISHRSFIVQYDMTNYTTMSHSNAQTFHGITKGHNCWGHFLYSSCMR